MNMKSLTDASQIMYDAKFEQEITDHKRAIEEYYSTHIKKFVT